MLFHLVISDKDKGVFNVAGPMTDDTEWNNKVVECQKRGRNVTCQTGKGASLTKAELITEVENTSNLTYTEDDILQ